MHQSSLANMKYFRTKYLQKFVGKPLAIYDLGSCDINGSYRNFFDDSHWTYCGLDLAAGDNVDIVLQNPYKWKEIKSGSADILITGQALEHVEYFWIVLLEIRRILKPGGLCCLIAPSSGTEHRFPVDCYRFFPDGFKAVTKFASLEELECFCPDEHAQYSDYSHVWKDTVFIGYKPKNSFLKESILTLRHRILKRMTGV